MLQVREDSVVAEVIKNIPIFTKHTDEFVLKILRRIIVKNSVWFASDFTDLGNIPKVTRALKELEKRGILIKRKTYPTTWMRLK